MPINEIAALKLLSDIFVAIAKTIHGSKGSPRKKFACDVVTLLNVFDEVDKITSATIANLKTLARQSDIGGRIKRVSQTMDSLLELEEICKRFLKLMDTHAQWRNALAILSPKTKRALADVYIIENRPPGTDVRETAIYTNLSKHLKTLRKELETMSSCNLRPYPKEVVPFPVEETIAELKTLQSRTRTAKKFLREFASANLTVEDIFS